MKHMQVLGVELKDYSVREAMRKVDFFLRDGRVATIAYISSLGLMKAENSPELKTFLSEMDMTVASDADILRAGGVAVRSRIKEIENDEFLEEFLKKLVRGRKKIYLLSDTGEQLGILEEAVRDYQPNIDIVGMFSMDKLEHDEDYLINEMNGLMPHVLISNISSPLREQFFENHHMKMNVSIWLMLKDKMIFASQNRGPARKLGDRIMKMMFRKKAEKYQNDKSEQ
nr:WecB/TagA/CpsF family glycosyltransferase [Lachnospiraceae bacterium]